MRAHRNIGLDFDDTLIPTRRALVNYFNRVHSTDVKVDVMLLNGPYNQGSEHPRIRRVRDWHEIAKLTT